jgi:ribosomal protein L17
MKVRIVLYSLKDASLNPLPVEFVTSSKDRVTEQATKAVQSLWRWASYKEPLYRIFVDDTLVGEAITTRTKIKGFRHMCEQVLTVITESRFTAEEIAFAKSSTDTEALRIGKAFQLKGSKITVDDAISQIAATFKAANTVNKYSNMDGKDTYKRLVGPEILALEEKASEERKQLSIQKKALQISAGN